MNRLTLLRHAKSSWDHSGLRDIQRPLNDRGRHDAPLMGRVCSDILPVPDLMLVSSAQRTRETAGLFLQAWGLSDVEVLVSENLYLAGRDDWVEAIRSFADRGDHIMVCGHQPGLGDLASWICRDFNDEVPTAAVISFTGVNDELSRDSGVTDFYGRPRDYPS